MATITDDRSEGFLRIVGDAVIRVWERFLAPPKPGCDLCGDTGYLDGPLGSWRPFCPRLACATRRNRQPPATRVW